MKALKLFMAESLEIEGINRPATPLELAVAGGFLQLNAITLTDVVRIASELAGGKLRCEVGMNVIVGRHMPPAGGPVLMQRLEQLIHDTVSARIDAWQTYCMFEHLHPFTDGNGRTGRLLWAWRRGGPCPSSFLKEFHYQTLDAYDRRAVV